MLDAFSNEPAATSNEDHCRASVGHDSGWERGGFLIGNAIRRRVMSRVGLVTRIRSLSASIFNSSIKFEGIVEWVEEACKN